MLEQIPYFMKTKTIRQSVNFSAPPSRIFNLLATSKGHKAFSGCAAKIKPVVGSTFLVYEGLHGKVLKVEKNRRIVLSWRCDMKGWPKEHFSKADFLLKKTKTGTKLTLTQTRVPRSSFTGIRDGWKEYYWTPIKEYLESKK